MQKQLIELHKQALLKKQAAFLKPPIEVNSQDGEGVTTRRQSRQTNASVSNIQSQNLATPVQNPKAQQSVIQETPKVPFEREKILLKNDKLEIYVVKSDLKRMVNFRMADHHFILRTKVNKTHNIKKNIY